MKPLFHIALMANSLPTQQINLKLFYNDFPQKKIVCHNHFNFTFQIHIIYNITLYTSQWMPRATPRIQEIYKNRYASQSLCKLQYLTSVLF